MVGKEGFMASFSYLKRRGFGHTPTREDAEYWDQFDLGTILALYKLRV